MQTSSSLGLAFVVGFAASAEGAVLRMDFGGGATEATVGINHTFTIDIWLDTPNNGAEIAGLATEIDGDASLVGIGNSTSIPGWTAAGVNGVLEKGLGAASHNVSLFANGLPDQVTGTGTFLLGTVAAHTTFPGSFPITFAFPSTAFALTDGAGGDIPYSGSLGNSYDSYFTFGTGAPSWGGIMGLWPQVPNPITLHVISNPEPAALALLGLGAIVALRRRSA